MLAHFAGYKSARFTADKGISHDCRRLFFQRILQVYQIPYLQIFFIGLISVIAFAFIYTGLLYLVNSVMFKGERSFKKVFTMYGVNSVVTSVTLLVTAIFMFINVFLGLLVLVLGSMLNMVYVYKGIERLGVKDKNKHGYIYLITTLFYGIVLFIISLIFS